MNIEYEYRSIVCPTCKCKITVETTICRGFSDREMVKCPLCLNDTTTIRADMGFEILNTIEAEDN